ncbi:hypothetical protein [Caballeronia sp. NK8]|uniref:hypothetical protein n=1 Tax=Caballeronia sp. NK8 TaxID=140098 RepID=UPI001BD14260|nr:hypothetical protein [Caballeronia sp. NK8]
MEGAHHRSEATGVRAMFVGPFSLARSIPLMSAPAQNVLPVKVSTRTRTLLREEKAYASRQLDNHQLVERIVDLSPVQADSRNATFINMALDGLVIANKLNSHSSIS